jgi:HEAT repeat protein
MGRWLASVLLVALGVGGTWAWGQVARLAAPPESAELPAPLYAAWQPADANQAQFFRSTDQGDTWQPLPLPAEAAPVAWAGDGDRRVAVALTDGTVLRSHDRGEHWSASSVLLAGGAAWDAGDRVDRGAEEQTHLPVISLAWGEDGVLYLGTDGFGVYRIEPDGEPGTMTGTQAELSSARIVALALVGDRLVAATPAALFYTDDAGQTWSKSFPVPNRVTALVAVDRQTFFVGTEAGGVVRTSDAGRTWAPALDGLGLAAGQLVRISALRADPEEPGVLYAAVDHLLGGTELHASSAGAFVTIDGGESWQPLLGPGFPEARPALGLAVAPGKPLYAQAVTASGLQTYTPDVSGALRALQSGDAPSRAAAARLLGLARAQEAGSALLAALADPEPAVSLAAAEALGRMDDPALVGGLLTALDYPQAQVRLSAARALGALRAEAAVAPLRAMLLQGEGLEVTVAAEALQKIGSPAAVEASLVALGDSEATPRWHAAMGAVERLGEPAVPALLVMLQEGHGYARRNAAEALGWIGSPAAVSALAQALDDPAGGVRRQAAWALGEIGDPSARAALQKAAAGDLEPALRAEANWALAQLRSEPLGAGATAAWTAGLAETLARLEPARWIFLAASLAVAGWLGLGSRRPALAQVATRER